MNPEIRIEEGAAVWNFDWPKAYPDTQARGVLKQQIDDFKVDEIPLGPFTGEGEHVVLHIKKQGVNTHWVGNLIAEAYGVKEQDVSYAGKKDRHGVTTQWFSVYLPKAQAAKVEEILAPDYFAAKSENDEVIEILSQGRHSKKLRRGDLLGNRFTITLRDVQGDRTLIEANLERIKQQGVPNYFGAQRFGHGGGNMDHALAMLTGKVQVRNRNKKGMYLSAARSYLFNQVIGERIQRGLWHQALEGDLDSQGQPTQLSEQASAPLWGRGRLSSTAKTLELEQQMAEPLAELCEGMEHAGLNQERRVIVCVAEGLRWQWSTDGCLTLSFALAAGQYATSVIDEIMLVTEADRWVAQAD